MRLTVAFPRKSNGKTIARALASLEGAAGEAMPILDATADRMAIEGACKTYDVAADLFARKSIESIPMDDVPASYGDLLPEKNAKGAKICFGRPMTSNLSRLANNLLAKAQGDYVLFMSPGEVCLDPLNITTALDHLDGQPQIEVVSCPVKIYSDGKHVKTVMAPKIFRRLNSKAAFTGVLADDWGPRSDVNWILSASGMTFYDHGDAWPDPSAMDLFDLKLLLHDHVDKSWPDDDAGRAQMVAEKTKVAGLLAKWNAAGAMQILDQAIAGHGALSAGVVPALVARARIRWRHTYGGSKDLDLSMADLDLAISISPTTAAHLERAFVKHGWDDSWMEDLRRGVEISKEAPMFGLDMREYRLANLVLQARPEADPKRCQESTILSGLKGDLGQCLQDADGHRTHETIDSGEHVVWCDP
jgi:hypothetical protein